MSLELFAKHYRHNIEEYEQKYTYHEEPVIQLLEPKIIKNPFLMLQNIYDDAIPSVNSNKFYSISFIGSQGFGKTFSAQVIASLAEHDGFTMIYGKAEDFLEDKKSWIEQVKHIIKEKDTVYICFVLDDMSYSMDEVSKKKSGGFKHFIADIRHVLEEKDENGKIVFNPKILMIYLSHRLHSLPPMLRNSGTWIFASMLPEDRADAMKLIPKFKEERERLDSMFKFLQKAQNEGPKEPALKLMFGDVQLNFVWGKEDRPGDGRLMMVSHAGEMKILQSKGIENMIDLEQRRILPKPKVEIPEEPKETEEDIRKKAMQMFPVTEEIPRDPFEGLKKNLLPINRESLEL